MYTFDTVTDLTPADLQPSDVILGFGASSITPTTTTRLVVTAETVVHESGRASVSTNVGEYSVEADTLLTVERPTATAVLLISRRAALHRQVLELGHPVIRRTPVSDDETATTVTAEEWAGARAVLFDGHLLMATIREFADRGDVQARPNIIMLGTDLDDARIFARARAIAAGAVMVLPNEAPGLQHAISVAVATVDAPTSA